MEATIPRPTFRERARQQRWRILAGTVALGATAFGVASFAAPASATDPHHDTITVECTTGIVTQGDVQTSSMVGGESPGECARGRPRGLCDAVTISGQGSASRSIVGAERLVRGGLGRECPGILPRAFVASASESRTRRTSANSHQA